MEAGEFATIQELAKAVGLAERHVSRQLRLAYLAPEMLKRLTCGREASAATLQRLIESALLAWQEQEDRVFGAAKQSNQPSGTIAALRKKRLLQTQSGYSLLLRSALSRPEDTDLLPVFAR